MLTTYICDASFRILAHPTHSATTVLPVITWCLTFFLPVTLTNTNGQTHNRKCQSEKIEGLQATHTSSHYSSTTLNKTF